MANLVKLIRDEGYSHKTSTNAFVINLMKKASCKSEESIDPLLMDQIIDSTFDPEAYSSLSHYIFRKLNKLETLQWIRIVKFEEIIYQILLRGHERFFDDLITNEHLIQSLVVVKRKVKGQDSKM